jgi:acyl carrier protein
LKDPIADKTLELLAQSRDETAISLDITDDRKLSELSIDSMKLVEILFQLEKAFGVEVPEDELGHIQTVGDLFRMIRSVVPGKSE